MSTADKNTKKEIKQLIQHIHKGQQDRFIQIYHRFGMKVPVEEVIDMLESNQLKNALRLVEATIEANARNFNI